MRSVFSVYREERDEGALDNVATRGYIASDERGRNP